MPGPEAKRRNVWQILIGSRHFCHSWPCGRRIMLVSVTAIQSGTAPLPAIAEAAAAVEVMGLRATPAPSLAFPVGSAMCPTALPRDRWPHHP